MLTINKTGVTLPAGNIQSNQKQNSPKLKTLNHDTVSFKSNEKLFLTKLRELCKRDWNADLAGTVEGLAHDVNPKHPDIVTEFDQMKNNQKIGKGLKAWIFDDLIKELGVGGNKRL